VASANSAKSDSISKHRPPLPEFRKFGLVPEVRQAVLDSGIYFEGRLAGKGQESALAGDLMVFLATLTDAEKISRWVIQLRAVQAADAAQQERNPVEMYSSTGNKWVLSRVKSPIEVTVLRPLAMRKTTHLLLSDEDARNAGLWGVVSTNLKLKDLSFNKTAYRPEFSHTPYSDERIESERTSALILGITPGEELSRQMGLPALGEFLSLIVSTPELFQMMARVVDISYFSALKGMSGAIKIETLPYESTVSAQQLGVAGADKAYVLPLTVSLGKKPIMLCQLALVQPRPPFQVSAGLVALAAGHPDGKGPVLTIELVSIVSAK
jgi:hypothetical protein